MFWDLLGYAVLKRCRPELSVDNKGPLKQSEH